MVPYMWNYDLLGVNVLKCYSLRFLYGCQGGFYQDISCFSDKVKV